jgi:uncharacterized OB-fold protein
LPDYFKPLPLPDGDTAPYWEAARAARLLIQRCDSCQRHIFYPRSVCPHCMSDQIQWVDAAGTGTVYSYTVVHRSPEAFKPDVPYVVALIDLDEGVRMMSNIVGGAGPLAIGARVEVFFDAVTTEITLPKFRLIRGGS